MTRNESIFTRTVVAVLCVLCLIAFVLFSPKPPQRAAVLGGAFEYGAHEEPRSPEWPKAREEYMTAHPDGCAVCSSKTDPQIHHKKPFHLFPQLELDQSNLIWLCGPGKENHHLIFGHLGNYTSYNPNVEQDCKIWSDKYKNRPKSTEEQ